MLDSGANCHILRESVCRQLGIPIKAIPGLGLVTSNDQGSSSSILVVTPCIRLVYGVGVQNSVAPYHFSLVTRDGATPGAYQVLLGNLENQTFGAIHDSGAQQYHLRTSFRTQGTESGLLTIPTRFSAPQGG